MEKSINTPQGEHKDDGKVRYDLLPAKPLHEVAKVFTWGASKYSDNNYLKGIKFSRLFGSCMRHCWAWKRGENLDPESNLPHLAHAISNLMMMLALIMNGRDDCDDRQSIEATEATKKPSVEDYRYTGELNPPRRSVPTAQMF